MDLTALNSPKSQTEAVRPPMNQPHTPISENDTMMEQTQNSSKNTLLTLASLLVLAGIVGITIFLYLRNNKSNEKVSYNNFQKITHESKYGPGCKSFTSINDALNAQSSGCILDLSGQNLTDLPQDITKLKNLKEIDLSNNNFTEFPHVLLSISSLVSIDLSNNKLTTMPDVTKLPTLQRLQLTGNHIIQQTVPTPAKNS